MTSHRKIWSGMCARACSLFSCSDILSLENRQRAVEFIPWLRYYGFQEEADCIRLYLENWAEEEQAFSAKELKDSFRSIYHTVATNIFRF